MPISPESKKKLEVVYARFRVHLQARQRLSETLNTLAVAGRQYNEVQTMLDALDQTDQKAMSDWAEAGAKGDAPILDHAKREDLVRDLNSAKARANAASAAAGPLDAQMKLLHAKCGEVAVDLKVLALGILASEAEKLGGDYRKALIEVERCKMYLVTLERFLGYQQDLEEGRTTAFLPIVQPHIAQRDFFVEPVRASAAQEASKHWQELWQECMRLPD